MSIALPARSTVPGDEAPDILQRLQSVLVGAREDVSRPAEKPTSIQIVTAVTAIDGVTIASGFASARLSAGI